MARPKKILKSSSKRVQVDMPPRSLERLKHLQDITEATSYSEVLRNALRLYEAMILETEAGSKILIERNNEAALYPIFGA